MTEKEDSKTQWVEPEENPGTFQKLKAMLEESKVQFELTTHKPVLTSEEAAAVRGATLDSGSKAILLKDSSKKLVLEGFIHLQM